MMVSAADNGVVVNKSRNRMITEANEGNEDEENGVRRGLSQSSWDSSERGEDVFTFVPFVSFCEKPPAGAQLLLSFFSAVAFCFIYCSIQSRSKR